MDCTPAFLLGFFVGSMFWIGLGIMIALWYLKNRNRLKELKK